jgi:hypothetical protein
LQESVSADGAILVDRAPQIVLSAVDPDEHLIQMA